MKIEFSIKIQISRNGNDESTLTDTSWSRLRKLAKKNSGSVCHYCGDYVDDGHLDHVIPLSRGGDDSPDNLVWSCSSCNLSKGAKLLDEWAPPSVEKNHLEDVGILPPKVSVEIVETYLESILDGETTTYARWCGSGNPFSRGQYANLISRLIRLDILVPRSSTDPARGYEITNAGKEKIKCILDKLDQTASAERI